MDLYILNEIQKLKSGGVRSGGSATDPMGFEEVQDDTSLDGWASFWNVNWHSSNSNINWTTTSPAGGSFYVYGNSDANNARVFLNNSRGSIYQSAAAHAGWDGMAHGHMATSTKSRLGYICQLHSSNNSQSDGPFSTNVMFVRNPTDTAITQTIYYYHSNGWNGGQEGSSMWSFVPNGDYQTMTGGTWTQMHSRTSGNSFYSDSGSVTIPPMTTAIIVTGATAYYWTDSYQAGLWIAGNQFYNIHNLSAAGLICDHSMSQTYQQWANSTYMSNKYGSDTNIVNMYHACATYFGNR
jgi:hypothetical protein